MLFSLTFYARKILLQNVVGKKDITWKTHFLLLIFIKSFMYLSRY